jgi:branched-chain amino acid transport system permease protein
MEGLAQVVILGFAKGSMWALLAMSFSLIYYVTGTFHLGHGAVFMVAAYLAYFFSCRLSFSLWISVLLMLPLTALLGGFIEGAIYRPLREKHASSLILLLASLSILVTLPAIIAIVFSPEPYFLDFPIRTYTFNNITVTIVHLMMFTSWIFIGLFLLYWHRSRIGKLMRAVADSGQVAKTVGIDVSRINIIGSMLAVPSALMFSLDQGIAPAIGFNSILMASAAAILGGVGSMLGAALGGITLGLTLSLSVMFIPASWQWGIAFLVLILMLLFRPKGIFGAIRW